MAIKIIKPGKKPDTFRFECPHCGCIFETDSVSVRHVLMHPDYFASCPTCHRLCCSCDDNCDDNDE